MLSKKLVLSSFLLVSICGCSRKKSCYWAAPPSSLFFLIKGNGKFLSDNTLNNIKISYIENGEKAYILGLGQATNNYANKGILAAGYISDLSAIKNIKKFYIEYPNNDIDTLFADYIPPSINTNCLVVLKQIQFNGQIASIDTSFKYEPVYIFNKP